MLTEAECRTGTWAVVAWLTLRPGRAPNDPADTIRVRAGDTGEEALFATFSFQTARDEVLASGFDAEEALDPRTGAEAAADTPYAWLSARVRRDVR